MGLPALIKGNLRLLASVCPLLFVQRRDEGARQGVVGEGILACDELAIDHNARLPGYHELHAAAGLGHGLRRVVAQLVTPRSLQTPPLPCRRRWSSCNRRRSTLWRRPPCLQ